MKRHSAAFLLLAAAVASQATTLDQAVAAQAQLEQAKEAAKAAKKALSKEDKAKLAVIEAQRKLAKVQGE